ncbi:thiolase family protein [Candidatus Woesearchaeota archaeon]|nr:thiolase family protein [Candidatus Woesearchaeota archaeon]
MSKILTERIVILDAVRTPVVRSTGDKIPFEEGGDGKEKRHGAFSHLTSDYLFSTVLSALLKRNPDVRGEELADILAGCAMQYNYQAGDIARVSAIMTKGIPERVPAATVNRLCASGLTAITSGAEHLIAGQRFAESYKPEVMIAGGVDSMSQQRMADFLKPSLAFRTGYLNLVENGDIALNMGVTAELLAHEHGISVEEQRTFAYHSHRKAIAALDTHAFDHEIIPVNVGGGKYQSVDDGARRYESLESALAQMKKLKPSFILTNPLVGTQGTVDAATSSLVSDGAAAVIVCLESYAEKIGVKPLAELISWHYEGVDPRRMGWGPVPAARIALAKAGLNIHDMGAIELNEAFAAQSLAVQRGWQKELDYSRNAFDEHVNRRGGAIALGHPLGATGARITATLLNILKDEGHQYGLITMCVGLGMGGAAVYKNYSR